MRKAIVIEIVVCALVLVICLYGNLRPAQHAKALPLTSAALGRAPSSLGVASSVTQKSIDILDANCALNTKKTFQTNANLIRISGKICKQFVDIHGSNTANGHDIIVLLDKETGHFYSNYFQLVEGKNIISLAYENSKGKLIQAEDLEIIRSQ